MSYLLPTLILETARAESRSTENLVELPENDTRRIASAWQLEFSRYCSIGHDDGLQKKVH
jgi:hypothetical protein